MYLYRHFDKPVFKSAVKVFIIVFCALGIAYITARPQIKKHLPMISMPQEDLQFMDVIGESGVNENSKSVRENEDDFGGLTEIAIPSKLDEKESEKIESVTESLLYKSPWTYNCVNNMCQRQLYNSALEVGGQVPVGVCWLTCEKNGSLWPIPASFESGSDRKLVPFNLANLDFSFDNEKGSELEKAIIGAINFTRTVLQQQNTVGNNKNSGGKFERNSVKVSIEVISGKDFTFLLDSTKENYQLKISSPELKDENGAFVDVSIAAETYFGVRHGLETLSQLIAFDEFNQCYQILGKVKIEDKPAFKYRGVLIDVARNFIPLAKLRNIVDGMSFNKFNALHLHFTDVESFPLLHPKFPEMSFCGSYSKKKVYTFNELKEFVNYARIRGIKIIPEFDPNHLRFEDVSSSEDSKCITNGPESNGFRLNLFQPAVLNVIGEFYKGLFDIFDNDVLHFGSFDLSFNVKCLQNQNNTGFVSEWMKNENLTDYSQLRPAFLNKVVAKIEEVNNGNSIQAIIFGSDLSEPNLGILNHSNYIIHTWENVRSSRVKSLVKGKYRIMISETQYATLNSGFNGPNHQYSLWQNLYDDSFQYGEFTPQILGSEVMIWTENTNEASIEGKLWPRASALAERLWSNPKTRDKDVYSRLNHHNYRMMSRGMKSESLQPQSCYLLNGNCDDASRRIR